MEIHLITACIFKKIKTLTEARETIRVKFTSQVTKEFSTFSLQKIQVQSFIHPPMLGSWLAKDRLWDRTSPEAPLLQWSCAH